MAEFSLNGHRNTTKVKQLAKGLGYFSIALGAAELIAPEWLAKTIGIRPRPLLTRLLGLREVTAGIGILGQERPEGWMWSRVAGDAMDLALLGTARKEERCIEEQPLNVAIATVAGVTIVDILCAFLLRGEKGGDGAQAVQTITIDRTPEELFNFWRNFENLPKVMQNVESVRRTGDGRSHWVARGPGGKTVEWDAEITNERPNESISWRAENGYFSHSGTVSFVRAPGDRGTIVRVELEYQQVGGSLGHSLARLFGQAPEQKIQLDLYRLKQTLETGMVITTEGQPAGRASSLSKVYDWGTTRG